MDTRHPRMSTLSLSFRYRRVHENSSGLTWPKVAHIVTHGHRWSPMVTRYAGFRGGAHRCPRTEWFHVAVPNPVGGSVLLLAALCCCWRPSRAAANPLPGFLPAPGECGCSLLLAALCCCWRPAAAPAPSAPSAAVVVFLVAVALPSVAAALVADHMLLPSASVAVAVSVAAAVPPAAAADHMLLPSASVAVAVSVAAAVPPVADHVLLHLSSGVCGRRSPHSPTCTCRHRLHHGAASSESCPSLPHSGPPRAQAEADTAHP